jgi:hypothetical protein
MHFRALTHTHTHTHTRTRTPTHPHTYRGHTRSSAGCALWACVLFGLCCLSSCWYVCLCLCVCLSLFLSSIVSHLACLSLSLFVCVRVSLSLLCCVFSCRCVWCFMSHVSRLMSHVSCPMSHVPCLTGAAGVGLSLGKSVDKHLQPLLSTYLATGMSPAALVYLHRYWYVDKHISVCRTY